MCSTRSIFVYNDARGADNKDPFLEGVWGNLIAEQTACKLSFLLILRLTQNVVSCNVSVHVNI